MVKPVSLSDPAFAALRKEKRPGESDSDVVLRLVREAHGARRDPLSFIDGAPHADMMEPEEHLRFLREMHDVDTRDPWEE